MRSQSPQRGPSRCTSARCVRVTGLGRVGARGVGRIQCSQQELRQRWRRWCGGPSRGATAVVGSRREMGQSLSVGSPVVRGICRGPSACITAPPPLCRSPPARSRLSACASGKSRAGRNRKEEKKNMEIRQQIQHKTQIPGASIYRKE